MKVPGSCHDSNVENPGCRVYSRITQVEELSATIAQPKMLFLVACSLDILLQGTTCLCLGAESKKTNHVAFLAE
jgi:hypothetical protein